MLKTIKGKVIAGTVSVVLLSSAGAAFANSDASSNLQNWYNAKFGEAKVSVIKDAATYSTGNLFWLGTENIGHKRDATSIIGDAKTLAINTSTTNINSESQKHILALNNKKDEILSGIGPQFDVISADATTAMNAAGDVTKALLIADLTRHTEGKGKEALKKVDEDLTSVKTVAVADLQTAINNAKNELTTKLNEEKNLTVTEIKAMIDAKIVELRKDITDSKEKMVEAQKALIATKALEYENAAKKEMEDLVNGI